MIKTKYIFLIVSILIVVACNTNQNSHGHSHDIIGGHAAHDGHEQESTTLSYTLFSEGYELFVEFPALVVGQKSSFAAHYTKLSDYRPVLEGKLTVSIIKGSKGLRHSVEAPSSPGIFKPVLQPKEAGLYNLVFELESNNETVKLEIADIKVFPTEEEAKEEIQHEENGEETSFLKEQAWKAEFATEEIKLQPFYSVISTSALVKGQSQSQKTMNAQAGGIVNLVTVLGESVRRGQLLALVTSSGLDDNLSIKLNESKIAFEKSKKDYNRTSPLAANQAISQKAFLEIEAKYFQDSVRYFQMAKNISGNGLRITAPFNGFVSGISVLNGEYLETGRPVITVSNQNQLLIEAFVNQSDFKRVNGIFDANFRLPGNNKTIKLSEINGKIKAKNAFVGANSTRIPISFTVLNNGSLMPGMFVEAFLLTDRKEQTIVVPLTAVIEEQGQNFVYVQSGGESFIKKEVTLANNDGINTEVIEGLQVGERIVTKGAYQIKLAAMAGDLPLHGHTH